MVEMVALVIGEPEAELETAVREGKAVDVEAKRSLAGRLVPAKLARILDPGR
jgi:hypothetical protein